MPAHAAPLPQKAATSPTSTKDSASKTTDDNSSSYFTTAASSVTGESLTTVVEEPSSNESSRVLGNDGSNDVYSPRAAQVAPSVATLEAEIAGLATATGKPVFSEPDFAASAGPVMPETVEDLKSVAPEVFRRSPGSFSADKLKEGEAVSPTER